MALEPIDEKDLNLKDKFINKKEDIASVKKEGVLARESLLESVVDRKEGAMEQDDTYAKIVSKIKTPSLQMTGDEVVHDADHVGSFMDMESKITKLVDMAMQKGVLHAVKVARHLDDNYVLDELHDQLVMDEFHKALVEKGMIKDV